MKQTRMTAAEYLEMERASTERHDFYEGEVFAMAGAKFEHNLIAANLTGELRAALRQRPCVVLQSDMRTKASATGLYTYPDVTIVCGEPVFEDADRRDTVMNPTVIVEVLSESTESYDRGTKAGSYRTIPSLTDYLLVSQTHVLVEHYTRKGDGTWNLRDLRAGDRIVLASAGCEIAVDEAYAKVLDTNATTR